MTISTEVEPKNRIADYILGKTLGTGTFGKVKIAEHQITGQKVAVKILNRQKISCHKQIDQKIRREIRILRLLRHPHIIRLYEVIETPTDIFMVMEYVSGGELFDHIAKNGRLLEDEARTFFQQIISGVEHIHHYRIVHRDLKPENLLLDENNNVRIADFGLSNLVSDGEFLRTSCGSPNYAAPEVISGKLYAGPEVDVWSCGVILYTLICGRLPFDEDSIPALFKKIKEGVYTIPMHISSSCRDLISRMLALDPVNRITIPQIREHEWFKQNLPSYISSPPSHKNDHKEQLDESILEVISQKLDLSIEIVQSAVTSGTRNYIYVAYYILKDAKLKHTYHDVVNDSNSLSSITWPQSHISNLKPAPILENLITRINEKEVRELYNEQTPNTLAFASSFVGTNATLDYSLLNGTYLDNPLTIRRNYTYDKNETAISSTLIHENWRLGVFTELPSNTAIQHIYRILKQMNLVWKVIAPYNLQCMSAANPEYGKIGIHLFRMHDKHNKGYLVDLVFFNEVALPALDLVHELYHRITRAIGA